jgi:hypothetical protein
MSLAKTTIVLSWLFVGLACVSTVIMLVRAYMGRARFRIWDACVCAALIVGILLISLMTWAIVAEGGGRHQRDLSQHQLTLVATVRHKSPTSLRYTNVSQSIIISEALWALNGALIRVSACCFLRELLVLTGVKLIALITLLCFSILHGVASILEICLICRPLTVQWNMNAKGACGNQVASYVVIEGSGMVLDVAILGLPIVVLTKVSLPISQKLGIFVALDAGVM